MSFIERSSGKSACVAALLLVLIAACREEPANSPLALEERRAEDACREFVKRLQTCEAGTIEPERNVDSLVTWEYRSARMSISSNEFNVDLAGKALQSELGCDFADVRFRSVESHSPGEIRFWMNTGSTDARLIVLFRCPWFTKEEPNWILGRVLFPD